MIFTGCNRTKSPTIEAIVVIEGEKISEAEIMLYLLQVKAQFEQVGGPEVWDTEDFSGGKTAEQVAKEGALANLFKYKILVSKASSMGVSMNQSVIDQTTDIAKQYFEQIPLDMISKHKITEQIVIDSFLDFRLANEVETAIKDNSEPTDEQISLEMFEDQDYATYVDYDTEEILTLVEVKQIFTRTANFNESELVPLSEEAQKSASDKINEAYNLALSGTNFDELISDYSENKEVTTKEISVFQLKEFFEDLSIGKISEIAQTDTGYYIFKVINITEPTAEVKADYEAKFKQWEDSLKADSISKLKADAFNAIYSEWEKETSMEVNSELWEKISIF